MLQTRTATLADVTLIAAHRKAMFKAIGGTQESALETLRQNCVPWLERMMVDGKYLGWITFDGERAVASAGLMLMDWPPGPFDPVGEIRGYILNVFVEPEYRGRGLATNVVEACMEESRRRGIRVITLHASSAGRPLYEALGFGSTNEMRYLDPVGD